LSSVAAFNQNHISRSPPRRPSPLGNRASIIVSELKPKTSPSR
jgi:hypothetical protein